MGEDGTWEDARALEGSGDKAVIAVNDGPEFPARETGAGVSFAWLWKCS